MRDEGAERPALAWPYIAILLGEVAVLGLLAATSPRHPPLSYEIGWSGVASMLVMQLYSVRRRLRALRNFGPLRAWLDAHIFLGLQGFVFVSYHSVEMSRNANLAALNFALVGAVILSGLTGRYLYGFIPRSLAGTVSKYSELVASLGTTASFAKMRRECRGLRDLFMLDVARRRLLRELGRDRKMTPARARAARQSILLASRISALEVADRWFSRWTLFHRPLAFLILGITTLHVLAHFAYAT